MKITVFGSTGRTGSHVLSEGLRRGHEITAFTRRPDALTNPQPGTPLAPAAVVHGDGRDPAAVREAITGADAVIAIIAASSRNGPHQAAEVVSQIIGQMTDLGVRRLVVTSAYPIVADKPRVPIALLRWFLATAYADSAAMAQTVRASNLDWTIAYLTRLTNKPGVGSFRISHELFRKTSPITRADAAAALLDIAEDATLAKTEVNVAGA
ncbi:MAG TPA: NAD(P)-binding oxidoreductase [Streptosporangiaceae bacterium]|nr:NAD(P)-binding oxidoreductase [Streptosporangiaceae bacterium]